MPKKLFTTVKTFAKNVVFHAKHVAFLDESAAEAFHQIKSDSRKLAKALSVGEADPEQRRHASKLVDKGRGRFNAKDYVGAEKLFRQALAEDPECGWACTFLGHALYHQNRHQDAKAAWQRAYEMDPASDAGLKAKKKLQHVERHTSDFLMEFQERLNLK